MFNPMANKLSPRYLIFIAILFAIVFYFLSLDKCLPGFCADVSDKQCSGSVCADETLGQHLNERATNIIAGRVKDDPLLLVLSLLISVPAILPVFILGRNKFLEEKLRDFWPKLFDYILKAFSDGRLTPKLYQ